MDDEQPDIRIGDRERREVDARLQRAHADGVLTLSEYDERAAQCWAARTRSDLEPLTRDLPAEEPAPTALVPAPEPLPTRSPIQRTAAGLAAVALAVGGLYLGSGILGADDGASVFGSRELQIADDQDRLELDALFGRVTVRVPDDVRVRTTGTMVFGDIECAAACQGGPVQREVVVDTTGGFGNVEVLRQNEQSRDERRDNDRDRNRDNDRDQRDRDDDRDDD